MNEKKTSVITGKKYRILRVKRWQLSLARQFTFIRHKMVFNSSVVHRKIILYCSFFGTFHFHLLNKDWNQPLLLSDFKSSYNCCSETFTFYSWYVSKNSAYLVWICRCFGSLACLYYQSRLHDVFVSASTANSGDIFELLDW